MSSLLDTLNLSINKRVLNENSKLVDGFNFFNWFLLRDALYIEKKHWKELNMAREKQNKRRKVMQAVVCFTLF